MWDWVGGRYSLWSAVGLSIALALGMEPFELLLQGGHDMDEHFRTAPLERNLPVLMGLIGVWNGNFLGHDSLAVLPYDRRLHRFPAYLQQLEMESNGKSVTRDGHAGRLPDRRRGVGRARQQRPALVLPAAAPGHGAGGDGFHRAGECVEPLPGAARPRARQLLRAGRGVRVRPDRAAGARRPRGQGHADAEIERLLPHKVHVGNRPSSLILFPRLGPRTLGRLIAWYEHKVFVQSVIWDVNPFDQWGVELGKKLAGSMAPAVQQARGPTARGTCRRCSRRCGAGARTERGRYHRRDETTHSLPLLALSLACGAAAAGEPWIAPGNIQVRHDVQMLVDDGVIDLPMSGWPIAASDLANALASRVPATRPSLARRPAELAPAQAAAIARLRKLALRGTPDLGCEVRAAARPTTLRTFDDDAARGGRAHRLDQRLHRRSLGRPPRAHRRRRSGRRRHRAPRRLVLRRQVRQLDRHRRRAGPLVGLGLGGQPDPVEQRAAGAGDRRSIARCRSRSRPSG